MPDWFGPSRRFQIAPSFDPLVQQYEDLRAARGDATSGPPMRFDTSLLEQQQRTQAGDDAFAAHVATTPGLRSVADPGLSDDASPAEWERTALLPKTFSTGGFGGKQFTYDPRLALGTELARARAMRAASVEDAQATAQIKTAGENARVARLVQAGYAEKEAIRQVFGGPRTVREEQEIMNTRSADQLERDKFLQSQIRDRQTAAAQSRAQLQELLERSRSGDRNATRELRRAQILLEQANREHTEAVRASERNALGVELTPPGASDNDLHAAVDQHLQQVEAPGGSQTTIPATTGRTSGAVPEPTPAGTAAARASAVDAVRTAGKPTPKPDELTDDDILAYIGGNVPAGGIPRTGAAPAAPTAKKVMSASQRQAAAKDPAYRDWLSSKGYDVTGIKP